MTKTEISRIAIYAARNSAGKPWENDAYKNAQMALAAELKAELSLDARTEEQCIAAICDRHGVEMNEHGAWIID